MLNLVLICLLILTMYFLVEEKAKTKKKEKVENTSDVKDYTSAYQAKNILTKNEWQEYQKLKPLADEKQLLICPKVRLLDIIEPRSGEGYMRKLAKIQSKHVDFVLTDKKLNIRAILELDDSSHDSEKRIERDHFVDEILTSVGYKVIHTRSIQPDTLNNV